MKESKEEKERKKKVLELLIKLKTLKDVEVSAALKGLQLYGDSSVISPIISALKEGVSEKSEATIISFLGDLKYTDSAEPIMEAVLDKDNLEIRQKLLTTIWNSKVDFSEYLVDFITIAVEGDFMEALECLTIIENLEGPFYEQQFLESQVVLSEYAEKRDENSKKAHIMSEIAIIIKDFESKHVEF